MHHYSHSKVIFKTQQRLKIDFLRRSFSKLGRKADMAPMQLVGALYNWTDDLPRCERTGIGFVTNQDYNLDDFVGLHSFEDRSFKFRCPDECCLYGVIDGHHGSKVSNFAAQKLPAELLLGQLRDDFTDDDVKQQLQDSFDCLAKAFVEDLINDSLMEKIKLEEHLDGLDRTEAAKKYPTLFKDLERFEKEIEGGCSAAVALVHKSKLFIANIGDARAVLCRETESGDLGLVQLSLDHTISTVSELQRIANLGVDIEKVQISGVLPITRSIGDWALKEGYKSREILKDADSEPVLSTPYVHGGEKIDKSMKFVVLMSAGVYKAYEEATGVNPEMVNNDIVSMVHMEINRQNDIEAVAQAVIDEIKFRHNDQYLASNKTRCTKIEDMTLLVRLFNMELGGQIRKAHLQTVPESRLMKKKSAKLTPLKMPSPRIREKKNSETDSPSSTGSSTPTSTTVNEVLSTPPGSNESMSPQFSHLPSYPYIPPPPLEKQMSSSSTFKPLQVEVDEDIAISGPDTLALAQKTDIPPPGESQIGVLPWQECRSKIPYKMERTGLYRPMPIQRDAGSAIVTTPSPDVLNQKSGNELLLLADNDDRCSKNHDKTEVFNRPPEPLETDEDGRINPYVDFAQINAKIELF